MKLNEMCGAEPGHHPAGQNVGSRVTAGINPGVGRCALPAGGDVWMQTTAGGHYFDFCVIKNISELLASNS